MKNEIITVNGDTFNSALVAKLLETFDLCPNENLTLTELAEMYGVTHNDLWIDGKYREVYWIIDETREALIILETGEVVTDDEYEQIMSNNGLTLEA